MNNFVFYTNDWAGLLSSAKKPFRTRAGRLLVATRKNNIPNVKVLFHKRADVNEVDFHGFSSLCVAIGYDRKEIFELLLNKGADIELKTMNEDSPLMIACYFNRQEYIKTLLYREADITVKNIRGNTALFYALEHGDLELIKLVMYDINHQNADGNTVLMNSCRNRNKIEITKFFLSQGANVDCQNEMGQTALMICVESGNTEALIELLKKGADTELVDCDGWTVLQYAVNFEYKDIELLLKDYIKNKNLLLQKL